MSVVVASADYLLRCGFVFVSCNDERYLVAPNYLAPCGIGEAADYAEENGFILPFPALVDEIWKAADLKLRPIPLTFTQWTEAEMSSLPNILKYQRMVRDEIGFRGYRLLAGSQKDIIGSDGKIGLYGWHGLNGKPIQPAFFGHSPSWIDYSQGLRLVFPIVK